MTTQPSERTAKHVLEPVERISEVLFGLIMVLTFTGSLSIAESDREYQGGFLVGVSFGRFDVAGYVFNPDESKPTWVVAFSLGF
jgi:hypothetical protein